ncbi:hypothetical protein KB553_08945 [Chryseobacterium rhizoplanae]|uniref:hypothetical protein n=1 Tax=Chryseobacterium rhizoplanae TaxID=1609531 RepID=UPI001CE30E3F|nr:hypothetical protein [Chryseobacterium rhizoplanae]UCA61647.1 hypothetical protein KB553_08945 [Chryseobacterium rhizoplanae]
MFKRLIIIISILGILYIPLRMVIKSYALEEIQGTVKDVHASSNRIPYYTFSLEEYPCSFYNKGNGTLSLLKTPPKQGEQSVSLMIQSEDRSLLNSNEAVFYFAFHQKEKLIDLYYSVVRPGIFTHFTFLFFYFLVLLLNVLGAYRYPKQNVFTHFIKGYLLLIFLLMFL